MNGKPNITYEGSERAVAALIRQLREDRGWSQRELSEKLAKVGCHIDHSGIQRIEAGKKARKITVDELFAFAMVFQIPVEQMLLDPNRQVAESTMRALSSARHAWGDLADAVQTYLDLEQDADSAIVSAIWALAKEAASPEVVRAVVEFTFDDPALVDFLLRESRPAAVKRRAARDLPIPDFKFPRPWEGK